MSQKMRSVKQLLVLATSVVTLSSAVFAQDAAPTEEKKGVTVDFSGNGMVRGVYQEAAGKELIEGGLSIIGKIDAAGLFEVVGVVRTGKAYGSNTNGIVDFAQPDGDEYVASTAMAVRNLYIQKAIKDHLVQIGALQPDNGLSAQTGLSANGWIDGGRVKINTEFGNIMVTGGQLSTNDLVDVTSRMEEFNFNYVEVTLSKQVLDNLGVQLGYENFAGENFVDGAVNYKLEIATDRVITAIAEAMVNVDTKAVTASAGLSADVWSLITGDTKGVVLSAAYVFRTDDATGRMADYRGGLDQCVGNHCGIFTLSVPVTKSKNVSLYTSVRVEEDSMNNRYEGGVKVTFGKKKK